MAGARGAEIDERFRYCAEALLSGESIGPGPHRTRGRPPGRVVWCWQEGPRTCASICTPTSRPRSGGALEAVATVESFKIDDMVAQQAAAKDATIALVTDSTVDLPEAAQIRLGS